MSECETLDKFVSRCQGCENVIGMLEHDKCSVLPILKLLAGAKEVSPDIEITFNNYENADDGEVVHFVIRR